MFHFTHPSVLSSHKGNACSVREMCRMSECSYGFTHNQLNVKDIKTKQGLFLYGVTMSQNMKDTTTEQGLFYGASTEVLVNVHVVEENGVLYFLTSFISSLSMALL